MLENMDVQTGGSFPISPIAGTYLLGSVGTVGCLLGVPVLMNLGRKPIFVLGQLLMGFAHIMVGICLINDWNLASFVFILLF